MRIDSPLMTNTVATGSFSGSFTGDGTGLTGVGGNPGGSNTQVQFNDNGSFGGSSNLTFDGTNLTVGGKVTATEIVTNIVSQSISFATGSNRFGDEITDTHTFTGSLNVTGSLNLPDSVKANFGDSSDLQIYHDGSNSYITDSGTGNLRIGGTQVDILNPDSNEFKARFLTDGSVELYYDNSKKFETYTGGIIATGNISGSGELQLIGGVTASVLNFEGTSTNIGVNAGCTRNSNTLNNVVIGKDAFLNATTPDANVVIGVNAGKDQSVSGQRQVLIGYSAGEKNQRGGTNTAVGYQALYSSNYTFPGPQNSVAIGYAALHNGSAHSNNVAVGYNAGNSIQSGGNNVLIGYCTGLGTLTTGGGNTLVGYKAGTLNSNDTNSIVIGCCAVGKGSNTVVIGHSDITNTYLQGDISASGAITGSSLNLSSVVNAGTDTDKFLVLDSDGNVDFRTGANVLSDIGGQASGNYVTDAGGAVCQVAVWSSGTAISGSNDLFFDTANNRLGIGTNSPSHLLHVDGNATIGTNASVNNSLRILGSITASVNATDVMLHLNDEDMGLSTMFRSDQYGNSQDLIFKNNSQGNQRFGLTATFDGTAANDTIILGYQACRIHIGTANYGNVGVGIDNTVNPPEKLTVGGNISGSGCIQIGNGHTNSGNGSSIAGGSFNTITGGSGFIGAGALNSVESGTSVIVGGQNNRTCYGNFQFIGGGLLNTGSGAYSVIGGGNSNKIGSNVDNRPGDGSVIVGGNSNQIYTNLSSIVGGCQNIIEGRSNTLSSFIGGGARNHISSSAVSSSIVGGFDNTSDFANTHIIGSGLTADKANYTFVNNLDVEGTVSGSVFSGSFVGDGSGLTGISGGGSIDGSGAANKLAIWSDSDTLTSDSVLHWDTGNNRLGIGTASPDTTLHVEGNLLVDAYNVGEDNGIFLREGFLTTDQPSITVWDMSNSGASPDGLSLNAQDGIRFRENSGEVARFKDGKFGIGTTDPQATLHADYGSTVAPSLTFGATAGQILQNENSEFAFGLHNASPYPLWIQGRNSSNSARNITLQPLGGNIGIGTYSPSTLLDVDGTTTTVTLVETSTKELKEDIQPLDSQLENLKKLKPIEFAWKKDKKKDFGLLAEDVEKVYPYLVEHDEEDKLIGVKYSKLTSVLVKALQEQQEQIEELKEEIKVLKQK